MVRPTFFRLPVTPLLAGFPRVMRPFFSIVTLVLSLPLIAMEKPAPTAANVSYGPHERNVLDLWTAETPAPAPLVVFIHGGGFVADSKEILQPEMLLGLRAAGYAVAAINYRYCGPGVPLPLPMHDAGRAVQFLRANAERWHLDPRRVGLCGGSAGAGIALWLAFHDDLAQVSATEPVARESTRVACAFVWDAQTSYDPRFFKRYIGGNLHRHGLIGTLCQLPPEKLNTPEAFVLFREISPISHVTRGDPPVFLYYSEPAVRLPPDADAHAVEGAHSPLFGPPLKRKVDAVGGVCVLRHRDDYAKSGGSFAQDMAEFFGQHLR